MIKNRKLTSTIAVIIPAYNEAEIISDTLLSVISQVDPQHIYLINDGSTDKTASIAKSFHINLLNLKPNQGKANAINQAIKTFKLAYRYRFIMPLDADTKLHPNFIHQSLQAFRKYPHQNVCCVVGRVTGSTSSWITAYRIWEYEIAQSIHKAAQSILRSIVVCPGCATVYRARVFKKVQLESDTLAEDMDFTFTLHRRHIGRIVYEGSAMVITQDPNTLKDYIKQIDRWYTGFWQCLIKHHIPWGGQTLDAQVALLAGEAMFSSLLVLLYLVLIPVAINYNPMVVILPLALDFIIFMVPTLLFTRLKRGTKGLLRYVPQLYLLRFISSLIFLKSFFKVVINLDRLMSWAKPTRYQAAS